MSLDEVAKHLPGKHAQQLHAGVGGSKGGSVSASAEATIRTVYDNLKSGHKFEEFTTRHSMTRKPAAVMKGNLRKQVDKLLTSMGYEASRNKYKYTKDNHSISVHIVTGGGITTTELREELP